MGLFEKIKNNITETGKFASEKAKIAKEIFVTREQIRAKKKEIRTLTYKIGQTYLDLHSEDYEEDFGAYIRGIEEAKAEMEAKEGELIRLKEQVKPADIDDDELADFLDEEDFPEGKITDDVEEAAEAVEEEVKETAESAFNLAEDAAQAAAEEIAEAENALEEAVAEAEEDTAE